MNKAFPEDHIYAAYVIFWADPDHWRTGASFHVSVAEAASFVKAVADAKKRGMVVDVEAIVAEIIQSARDLLESKGNNLELFEKDVRDILTKSEQKI